MARQRFKRSVFTTLKLPSSASRPRKRLGVAGKAGKLQGLAEMEANIKQIIKELDGQSILRALNADGATLRSMIQLRVPRGPSRWIKGVFHESGALYESIVNKIFSRQRKGRPSTFVAIDRRLGWYAHMVEYGTIFALPHPFYRPALRAFRKLAKTEGAVARILRKDRA